MYKHATQTTTGIIAMNRISLALLKGMLLTLGCATMAACGGSGGGGSASTIKGTAAVGAPITNASVSVQCGSASLTTQTDSKGNYSITQKELENVDAILPCALKVSSPMGNLFSYSYQKGISNISPLTTLALGRAVNNSNGQSLDTWFTTLDDNADHSELQNKLDEAVSDLENALKSATGEDRIPFDVFSSSFKADGKSDYDVWLDSFRNALEEANQTFGNFTLSYTTQGDASSFGSLVITLNSGTESPIPGGDYELHVTVKVAGAPSTTVVVGNVPKPASKNEFCGDDSYAEYMNIEGFKINSCSFSGNKGTIKATVSAQGYNISYEAIYEWK